MPNTQDTEELRKLLITFYEQYWDWVNEEKTTRIVSPENRSPKEPTKNPLDIAEAAIANYYTRREAETVSKVLDYLEDNVTTYHEYVLDGEIQHEEQIKGVSAYRIRLARKRFTPQPYNERSE